MPYIHLAAAVMFAIMGKLSYAYGQTCLRPTIISVNANLHSAEINWIPSYPAGTTYEVEIIQLSPDVVTLPIFETSEKPVLIDNLNHSTQYRARVRAICPEGPTMWSPAFMFNTHLTNEGTCPLGFEVVNDNCNTSNYQDLIIKVEGISGNLGEDVELSAVELLMLHTDPSDMDIQLISPSGQSMQLIKNYGLGQNDFGDIDLDDCEGALIFDNRACIDLTTSPGIPLRGRVKPFESFASLHDGEPASGSWILRMCDRHIEDLGQLEYIRLVFDEGDACLPPSNVDISDIRGHHITAHWTLGSLCDSIIFELTTEGRSPGDGAEVSHPDHILHIVSCHSGESLLDGLLPDQAYTLYARTKCNGNNISINTCGLELTTLCGETSVVSNFDNLGFCEESCDTLCTLDDIWSNAASEQLQWIINRGSTPTNNTGPSGDLYNKGNYIYVASSNPECVEGGPALLESTCLRIPEDETSCFFQFSFHMWGNDIASLIVDVTTDGGHQRDTVLNYGADRIDNAWQTEYVDLSMYAGSVVSIRFIGNVNGPRGNIALDELLFLGDIQLQDSSFVFYRDADGDGFGNPLDSITTCFDTPPPGYVDDNTDCDDTNPNVNPGMDEIPCNLIDDNCSGVIDDVESDLIITSIESISPSCVGVTDGQIGVNIEGGQPPFAITWSDGHSNGSILQNIGIGRYGVTVEDDDGCLVAMDSIEIIAEQVLNFTIDQETAASCEGIPNGGLVFSIEGGQSPYAVIWSDGGEGLDRSDLTFGTYAITVSDAIGCEHILEDIEVDAEAFLEIDVLEQRPPACPSAQDGVIRLRGKTDPLLYQYEWSNGQSGPIIRDLGSSIYEVTITRTDNACITERQFELVDPDSVSVQLLALDPVSCPDRNDGRIEIAVTGGKAPYSYRWTSGSQLHFTRNLSSIGSGDYDLLITDAHNCQYSFGAYTVEQPPPFELANLDITPNKCLLSNNGSISAEVAGGTPDYQYLWSNGGQDHQVSDLFNGTYFMTVTDQFDCKHVFGGFTITSANAPLETDISEVIPNNCFGDRDGRIIVDVLDGVPPIEFHWSSGQIRTTDENRDTLDQLSSRTYALTITDQDGCMAVLDNIIVPGPTQALGFNVTELNMVQCHGEDSGSITIVPKGGTAPYTTQWNDGGQGSDYRDLRIGDYQFTLTDFNGCEVTSPIIRLTEPPPLRYTSVVNEDGCTVDEGSLSILPSGGVAPYDVNWYFEDDTINQTGIHQLSCGTYQMQLMDHNGCTKDTTFFLGVVSTAHDISKDAPHVYPNPFDHTIFVELPYAMHYSLALRAADGRVVHYVEDTGSMVQLQVRHNLPAGMYILSISTDKQLHTFRLIKQ